MSRPNRHPLALALAAAVFAAGCGRVDPPPLAPAKTPTAPPAATRLVLDESALPPLPAFKPSELDPGVSACTDLNAHVNGRWLAANPVPADQRTWGTFELLGERSLAVQKQIVERLATMSGARGVQKQLGDFWATGMDQAAIDAAGLQPIQPLLDRIESLATPEQLRTYLMAAHAANQSNLFGVFSESDFKDSSSVIAYVSQGGLGLPDKTYYAGQQHAQAREGYRAHVAKVLGLAGADAAQAAAGADAVLRIETTLAEPSYSAEELQRDFTRYYNPVTLAEADAATPGMGWKDLFDALGIAVPERFSLSNPAYFQRLTAMLGGTPLADWKAYLRFHAIDDNAAYLPSAFDEANFAFFGKTLRGQLEQQPRWKRVLGNLNGAMGDALGQLYVEVAFPPSSKAKMEQLVANLQSALRARLEKLEWMSPQTRAKALEKAAAFSAKIGYPDQWRDWTGLETSRAGYAQNALAAAAFNLRYQMNKVGKPKDKREWGLLPQTVNAGYNPLLNQITFPAAILQAPFFDPDADPALNYGGIGGGIGHEMLHGYDDQGSRFDKDGNLRDWWQPEDKTRFNALTRRLVEQFDGFAVAPGKHVNGTLTLGENIADLGGITVAYDAMKLAQASSPPVGEIDGMTQDQRFFVGWSTVWRRHYTEKETEVRLVTDEHAPSTFRANGAPQNLAVFANAFGCKDGDPMVRSGDKRIAIW